MELARYVVLNPVCARMVELPEQWLYTAESKNMNIHQIYGVTMFRLYERELSSKIRTLFIHGKVVIDGES